MQLNKEGFFEKTEDEVLQRYKELYPGPTPIDCPWLFDPLNPPEGWHWDYEWEYWVKQ